MYIVYTVLCTCTCMVFEVCKCTPGVGVGVPGIRGTRCKRCMHVPGISEVFSDLVVL